MRRPQSPPYLLIRGLPASLPRDPQRTPRPWPIPPNPPRVAAVADPLIREYEERDRDACRALWVQLTQWHRDIYDDQSIGSGDPAGWFDSYLAEKEPVAVWVAELDERVVGFTGALPVEGGAR